MQVCSSSCGKLQAVSFEICVPTCADLDMCRQGWDRGSVSVLACQRKPWGSHDLSFGLVFREARLGPLICACASITRSVCLSMY